MPSEWIEILTGSLAGRRMALDEPLTIGRAPGNKIQFLEGEVSSRHAVVEQDETGAVLRDLVSTNGTFVDDKPVVEYRLSDGDVFRVGPYKLRFEVISEAPADEKEDTGSRIRYVDLADSTVFASTPAEIYESFVRAPTEAPSAKDLLSLQKRLMAVYEANQIITNERDLGQLFGRIMGQIFSLISPHNGVILLKNEETGELADEYVRSAAKGGRVPMSRTVVKRAFEDGETILSSNIAEAPGYEKEDSILTQNIASVMCVPLVHQNETLGVVYVDTRGVTGAFQQQDLELLVALSRAAATAIRNAQYLRRIESAYHDTLYVLANAIELRDHYTAGHTWRVTHFALEVAREMGWSQEALEQCEIGGFLHDVGKIAVDDAILRKPGALTDEQRDRVRVHPLHGAHMLQGIPWLKPFIPYVLYHHERYDGVTDGPAGGYPHGLAGEDIPIEGRLINVADAFDALTSSRPYHDPLDPEKAVAILEKDRGTRADPEFVDALVRCYRKGKLDHFLQHGFEGDERSIVCPFCSTYTQIPEGAEPGDEFGCDLCSRRVRLLEQHNVLCGELVTADDA